MNVTGDFVDVAFQLRDLVAGRDRDRGGHDLFSVANAGGADHGSGRRRGRVAAVLRVRCRFKGQKQDRAGGDQGGNIHHRGADLTQKRGIPNEKKSRFPNAYAVTVLPSKIFFSSHRRCRANDMQRRCSAGADR